MATKPTYEALERRVDELEKKAREWARTFDAVPDLIAIIDDQHRIVRANRAMADRLGCTPQEAVGLTCYRCIHGTEAPPPFCPHVRLLADGQKHTVEVFERSGYTVLVAERGERALEIYREKRHVISLVILVLCDLTMPHLDGWQTLAALRRIQPEIPVVLASGYDRAHTMAGDHPEQPQAFLHKPYEMKTLKGVLQKAFAGAPGSMNGRKSGAQHE
jgi:PAS domain S-box-containing protein